MNGLTIFDTHPIQYHGPVYRYLHQQLGIPLTVIYGSDFSVVGYTDKEFRSRFAWDSDLLSGYDHQFLSRASSGKAASIKALPVKRIHAVLKETEPRSVLILGYAQLFHLAAFWAARRQGVPILFRGDTEDHSRRRSLLHAWFRDRYLRRFYGGYSKLLYKGRRSYEHFVRLGFPQERLISSPYCVNTEPFQAGESDRIRLREETRKELGIAEEEMILLFSGKLSPRKGPDLIVKATKRLSDHQRRKTVILFMGDGELRETLEELAKTEPAVKTSFVGFQNQSALSRYYHAADFLVVPSRRQEGWGLVVNDAFHHGLPCVASEGVGAVPDLIVPGETGALFRNDSSEDLAAVIEASGKLVGSSEVREKCRQRIAGYSVQKAAEGIAQAYRETTDQGG